MDIYQNIKVLRSSKGMTLEELGKAIGVTKQTIQKYEAGIIKGIPYDTIIALADTFGITPSALMGWEEIPEINGEEDCEFLELLHQLSKTQKNAVKSIMTEMIGK